MGNKTLVRLLVALAVVGGLALVVKMTGAGKIDRATTGDDLDRKYVFEDLSASDIAKMRITTAEGQMNFVRDGSDWSLAERDSFPVDGEAVGRLLLSAGKLKIMQQPTLSASSFGSVQLLDPVAKGATPETSATVVNFIGEDGKEKAEMWLGKLYAVDNGRPSNFGSSSQDAGRYVRTGDADTVFLVEETFADLETEPAGWLKDSFFTVTQIKSIERKSKTADDDWKLVRTDPAGEFAFAKARDGEELDLGKISTMKNAFASPRFEDLLVGEAAKVKPDEVTFIVETFESFTYTVKIGEKSPAGEYNLSVDVDAKLDEKRKPEPEETEEEAKKRDEDFAAQLKTMQDKLTSEKALAGRIFKVRSFVADPVNKKRSELLKSGDDPVAGDGAPGSPGAPGAAIPGFPQGIPGFPGSSAPIPAAPKPAAAPEPAEPKPVAPPKPEATKPDATPAEAAEKPAAKPAEPKPAPTPATTPKPEAKPAAPAEKPAAKPAEAKPAEKPAEDAKPEAEPAKPAAEPAVKPAEAAKPEA